MTNSLDFLKSKITYAYIDGEWWFRIDDLCTALQIDPGAQKKRIRRSQILRSGGSNQTLDLGDLGPRKVYCISERRLYMWLAGVQSKNPYFIKWQEQLADKIYDLMRGSLVAISAAATAKRQADIEIEQAKEELGNHPAYIRLRAAETRQRAATKKLNASASNQASLFN